MGRAMLEKRACTAEQVKNARSRWRSGETALSIAGSLGVTDVNAARLIRGITYKEIPGRVTDAEWRQSRATRRGE
jgi:hypothetical protein